MPIVACVIGEGGSGGAPVLGVADRLLMLEHATYSVAAPEAAASIRWRHASKAPEAANTMKTTAQDQYDPGMIAEIIPEPDGGAYADAVATAAAVGRVLHAALEASTALLIEELLWRRYTRLAQLASFRNVDHWQANRSPPPFKGR